MRLSDRQTSCTRNDVQTTKFVRIPPYCECNARQSKITDNELNKEEPILFLFMARCYAKRGFATVSRPSVCPSVSDIQMCFHIRWNISKIVSRLIRLRLWLGLTPKSTIWSNGNAPKFGWHRAGVSFCCWAKNL